MADQPTAQQVHIDTFGESESERRRKAKRTVGDDVEAIERAEAAIYKRDFTAAERKQLASEGKALPDGSYPIDTAADLHPASILARSGHGDVAGAKALIGRRAKTLGVTNPLADSTAKADLVIEFPIRKAEREGKVWGVVLDPTVTDSQKDDVSAEEIAKACHKYMVESRKADVRHSEEQTGADLIENYIAPADLVIEGQPVAKGCWIQAWQINDPIVKQEVDEKKLTGFSIGGSGFRVR